MNTCFKIEAEARAKTGALGHLPQEAISYIRKFR